MYISDESVGKRVHRDATRTEFSVCFSLGYSGLRLSPQIFRTKVHKCAPRSAMHAVFQIFRRDTWGGGEREKERGRETTGSNCQPGYAVRSILVKFFIRRVSLAHLLARRLISGRER